MASVLWFRRDLRLRDNPALLAAAESGPVVPLFVVDPVLWERAGAVRQNYLVASLRSLGASLGRNLLLIHGRPEEVVPRIAKAAKADAVHIAADYSPYGQARDARVGTALKKTPLVRTGSPYAVAPGRVTKADGTAYRVYTPFFKAWLQHGWRAPADDPGDVEWWMPVGCQGYPSPPELDIALPPAGEDAAWERWETFRATGLADYAELRNRPDIAGTSSLSQYLRFGEIHPRSLLTDLGDADEVFRKEICWREFYADVLFHNPSSTTHSLDPRYDTIMRWTKGKQAREFLEAWQTGMTGFPFVDAGMRQLRDEGWMHNRVRMVVASFLVKDLHLPWQRGAEHFMHMLRDGDVASNSHGWQWTAGCGTDASPFYRVFNPIGQGEKFDPDGDYVRRYVPELAHIPGSAVHQPWNWIDGYAHGYPEPIVDHAHERQVALADFAAIKGR
ncbi:MAG: deoxyribodipyrimidine photo-lyase [Actinobacteria bacterium]|nr:deoxyribodipyrimidine photo-lyase [Actinomycetota bacterium]